MNELNTSSRTVSHSRLALGVLGLFLGFVAAAQAADGDGFGLREVARTGPALPTSVLRVGSHAVVGTDNGLLIVEPVPAPRALGHLDLASPVRGLAAIDDDSVAVAAGPGGLLVVDIDAAGVPLLRASRSGGDVVAVASDGVRLAAGVIEGGLPRLLIAEMDVSGTGGLPVTATLDLPGVPTSIAIVDAGFAVAIEHPSGILLVSQQEGVLVPGAFAPTAFPPWQVRTYGERLVVACGASLVGEILALDIRDPAAPHRVAGLRLPDCARDIVMQGDLALVAASSLGITGVDTSDDANWRRTCAAPSGRYDISVAVGDALPWILSAQRSSSGSSAVAKLQLAADGRLERGAELTMAEVNGIARSGDTLVVLTRDALEIHSGMPGATALLGRWTRGNADLARLAVQGNLAAISSGAQIEFVDFTDPARPIRKGQISVERGVVAGLAFDGSLLVAVQGRDVEMFDVADPLLPRRSAVMSLGGPCLAVAAEDGRAVVAAGSKLFVLDVHDRDRPFILGSVSLATDGHAVAISGNRALFGTHEGRLSLVDISDPRAPRVSSAVVSGPIAGLAFGGDRVAVAESDAGVGIMRVTAMGALVREAWLDLPGTSCAVAIMGDAVDVSATGAQSFHLTISQPSVVGSATRCAWLGTRGAPRTRSIAAPAGTRRITVQ